MHVKLFEEESYVEVTEPDEFEETYRQALEGRARQGYTLRCRDTGALISLEPGINIAILGETAAGKSHLLFGWLFEATKGNTGVRGDLRLRHADAMAAYRERIDNVFEYFGLLQSNKAGKPQDQEPIQYLFDLRGFAGRVTVHDFAGELGSGHDLAAAFAPYIEWADYFIFCVEPAMFPTVASALSRPASRFHPIQMIRNFADIYREAHGITTHGKVEPVRLPAALVLTKADQLLDFKDPDVAIIVESELKRFLSPAVSADENSWFENVVSHNENVKNLIERKFGPVGKNLVEALRGAFTDVSYHLASALGGEPRSEPEAAPADQGRPQDHSAGEAKARGRELWEENDFTLSGVVEPFARALWITAGRDPIGS